MGNAECVTIGVRLLDLSGDSRLRSYEFRTSGIQCVQARDSLLCGSHFRMAPVRTALMPSPARRRLDRGLMNFCPIAGAEKWTARLRFSPGIAIW
jgi:hypothetical protein